MEISLTQVIGLTIAAVAVIGLLTFMYLEYKRNGTRSGN